MGASDIVFDDRYETVEGHLERDRDGDIGVDMRITSIELDG